MKMFLPYGETIPESRRQQQGTIRESIWRTGSFSGLTEAEKVLAHVQVSAWFIYHCRCRPSDFMVGRIIRAYESFIKGALRGVLYYENLD